MSTSPTLAQIKIGNFYSKETKDWIEIKNLGSDEIEVTGYSLWDTAASSPIIYEWKSKTILPAGGSCVAEVGNRLNNGGDTIYLKDFSGEQIDCVSYLGGNGGECTNQGESLANSEKPESSCVIATQAPQETPAPSAKPEAASTPSPTVRPTPVPTIKPSPKPRETAAGVLAARNETEKPSPEPVEGGPQAEKRGLPFPAILLVLGGVIFMGVGSYPFLKKRLYNKERVINEA